MTTPAPETLLTIEQAAAILAVNERMIRRLIETRRIAFVKVGRHVRFRERDLTAAIQAWTIAPRQRTSAKGRKVTHGHNQSGLTDGQESAWGHSTAKP
jgi:excisionase family DNA binding protein